jgi:hypothetical protein
VEFGNHNVWAINWHISILERYCEDRNEANDCWVVIVEVSIRSSSEPLGSRISDGCSEQWSESKAGYSVSFEARIYCEVYAERNIKWKTELMIIFLFYSSIKWFNHIFSKYFVLRKQIKLFWCWSLEILVLTYKG